MIYRAAAVVTMTGPPLRDGAVVVMGNRIRAVGAFADITRFFSDPVEDLGQRIILPGLINAHCHLNYTMMRHAITPPRSFTQWVQRINALKRSLDSEDYARATARGFAESMKWGTTTVLNIESFPELMLSMPPPPLRTWWFYELIDIRNRVATEELVAGALLFFQAHAGWLGGFGLSPHAPYTASPDLYRLANDCAKIVGMPLTTHVAESREEDEMFREGRGPLYEFVASLGRSMDDCGHDSSFTRLAREGLIGAGWIIAHLNTLSPSDLQLFSDRSFASQFHVVHCPRSHRYFHHPEFQLKVLRDLGVNICLGTDSLASNDSLDLFSEMRSVRATHPGLEAVELLAMVTTHPARALALDGHLGCIAPGALADLIAIPLLDERADFEEQIVANDSPAEWMLVDGQKRI